MNANRTRTLRPLAAAIALALSGPAGAAVIPVDGTTCTLADAVSAANTDTATGGCPAGQGDDVLELIADTYALTSPLPAITSRVTILGDPDGNHDKAVIEPDPERDAPDFDLLSVSGGDLKLRNVIVRNGSSGIVAKGGARVELAYSGVSGNRFNGIYAAVASVMVRHTTVSGNGRGKGLDDYGMATVEDSVISGNAVIQKMA